MSDHVTVHGPVPVRSSCMLAEPLTQYSPPPLTRAVGPTPIVKVAEQLTEMPPLAVMVTP